MTDTQDLIAQLRLGASISRDRNLNLDFAKVADEAADKLEAAQAEIERLEKLSVTNILLAVVPGDGSGLEVYAQSVADVEQKLGDMGSELEDWQLGIKRYPAFQEIVDQRDAALARLAEMTKQEPVGYAYKHQDYIGSVIGSKGEYGIAEIPLYAAAGASPQPVQGLQSVADALTIEQLNDKVERLMAVQPSQAHYEEQPDGTVIPVDPSEMQPSQAPCKGTNCGSTDDVNHSTECHAEHDAAANCGTLDTPGNRNPEHRYAGYKGQAISAGATDDQVAAYQSGVAARVQPSQAGEACPHLNSHIDWDYVACLDCGAVKLDGAGNVWHKSMITAINAKESRK